MSLSFPNFTGISHQLCCVKAAATAKAVATAKAAATAKATAAVAAATAKAAAAAPHLDHLGAVTLGVSAGDRQHFQLLLLGRLVRQRHRHFAMGVRVRRMRPICQHYGTCTTLHAQPRG